MCFGIIFTISALFKFIIHCKRLGSAYMITKDPVGDLVCIEHQSHEPTVCFTWCKFVHQIGHSLQHWRIHHCDDKHALHSQMLPLCPLAGHTAYQRDARWYIGHSSSDQRQRNIGPFYPWHRGEDVSCHLFQTLTNICMFITGITKQSTNSFPMYDIHAFTSDSDTRSGECISWCYV